ncbi:MAG: DUF4142 domain-containing protein, partial [Myxococcota bacterium]|nr:DUF4142 domain-containing protein [Myxococcota bacterium]
TTANTGEIAEGTLAAGATDAGSDAADAGLDAGARHSTDAAIIAFADMMITEHTQSNAAVAAFGIAAQPSTLQSDLQVTANAALLALAPLHGRAFDLQYLATQIAAHTSLRATVRDQLIPSAQDPRLKTYLQNVLLPAIEAHLARAINLLSLLTDAGLVDAASEASDGAGGG